GRNLLSITVKAVDGGRVSRYLVSQAPQGSVFHIGEAFGDFSVPTAAPLLLLARARSRLRIGVMPLPAASRPLGAPVDLYYWERSHAGFSFREELLAMAAADPQLQVRLLATRDAQAPAARIDNVVFDSLGDVPLAQRHVLACGPDGFVAAARNRLLHHVAGFQAEAFTPPPVPAGDQGEVQLTLARSGRTLSVPRGRPLLDSLEAHGLKPKHGCRMGICNTCTCVRASGATRHLRTGQDQDEPAMPVRICVSAPTTDLVLDI
ncbi:oxidoreductase, partial [Stenotrophomonas chelatiphaga]